MVHLIVNCTLILFGLAIQCGALIPARRIIEELPESRNRQLWRILKVMIYLFILGYAGYGVLSLNPATPPSYVVSVIFFAGALFVLLVCYLAQQTVEDVRHIARLEQENITDALTGLYNRRHLDSVLKRELGRSKRYALTLSLIMLDIDHFKAVNDTHGHDAGDEVLRAMGRIIRDNARDTDIAARYGGEEMTLILPSSDNKAAMLLAERLREVIENYKFSAGDLNLDCTVILGVATMNDDIQDAASFLQAADRALYQAKEEGRNRVVSADAVD